MIDAPGRIHDFFVSPVIDRPAKERVLAEAFEGKVHQIALHALLLLVRKRREALLGPIVAEYLALQRAARGVEPLTLDIGASARPSRAARARRAARTAVRQRSSRSPTVVDPSLIGGVRIMMGDRRIDGSVAGRLDASHANFSHIT